ncbi:MAG: cobalamin biosynthesis protein CobD [Prevotella sp.]|nr:cobalamin biosynthesis protein CobD [Prevotella sp.]
MACAPLLVGWMLDFLLGDPVRMPHIVVFFGKLIALLERWLNPARNPVTAPTDSWRRKAFIRGAVMAVLLTASVFALSWAVLWLLGQWSCWAMLVVQTLLIFQCLAGTSLIREVRAVFRAVDRSLDEGRRQVARIVGRDTSELTAQEVRTAALETLAENLSDGVIAPLFWLMIAGVPGMLAYKMVNTLDSMVGYRTERYLYFGRCAARMDDVANYLPARLTAFLMWCVAWGRKRPSLAAIFCEGHHHASPNSGYPEAALALTLNCRFGGPHTYFGQLFDKPYIGTYDRLLTTADMHRAIRINRGAEVLMVLLTLTVQLVIWS